MKIAPCHDCGVETLPLDDRRSEWYMVKNEVWKKCGMTEGYLCIGCLEGRLGRALTATDFTDAPVNGLEKTELMRYAWSWRSRRLTERLNDVEPL